MISSRIATGFLMLLTLSGCSKYRFTIQGVNLDHFYESRTVSSDSSTAKREASCHNDLGVLLEKEGDLTGALNQYRIARELDPGLVLAYINAGNVNVKLNRLSHAEAFYRRALDRDPDQTLALNNLAWVYIMRNKNLGEAIGLLERAIRADPENRYRYLDSLGWAMYAAGHEEEALETLNTALAETPPDEKYLLGETHYHLGLIFHARGEKSRAGDHFQKSLEIHPSSERELEIEEILIR